MKETFTFFTVENVLLVEHFPAGEIVINNFNVLLQSWADNKISFVSLENQKKVIPVYLNYFYTFLFKLLNFTQASSFENIANTLNSNTSDYQNKKIISDIKKNTNMFYKNFPHLKNNFQLDELSSLYFKKIEFELLLFHTDILTKEKNKSRARLSPNSESLKQYKKILKLNKDGHSIYRACIILGKELNEDSQKLESRFSKWAKTNKIHTIKHHRYK